MEALPSHPFSRIKMSEPKQTDPYLLLKKRELLRTIFELHNPTDPEINAEFDRRAKLLGLNTHMNFANYALVETSTFKQAARYELPERFEINEAFIESALNLKPTDSATTLTDAQLTESNKTLSNWRILIKACAVLRHPNPPNSISLLLLNDAIEDSEQAKKHFLRRENGEFFTQLKKFNSLLEQISFSESARQNEQKKQNGIYTPDLMPKYEKKFSNLYRFYLTQKAAIKELLYECLCSSFICILNQNRLPENIHLYLYSFQAVLLNHKTLPGTQVGKTLVPPVFFLQSPSEIKEEELKEKRERDQARLIEQNGQRAPLIEKGEKYAKWFQDKLKSERIEREKQQRKRLDAEKERQARLAQARERQASLNKDKQHALSPEDLEKQKLLPKPHDDEREEYCRCNIL